MKPSINAIKLIDCILTNNPQATMFKFENVVEELENSLKISRDDFAKMNDREKAKFINKMYYEYTEKKCIEEKDNCFYDVDSDTIIDDLYGYGLDLNDEFTDVHHKLFK